MTKRSSLLFVILTLVFGAAITLDVHAASCGGVDTTILNCSEDGEGAVTHIVLLILDIMTIGIGILGVIGISVAGVQYLTAAGDTTKATKSKRRIFEIVIGLACYALIWVGAEWLMPGGAFNAVKSNANSTQTTQNNGSNATNTNTVNPPNTPTANQSNATPTNNSASSQSNSKSSSNTSSNSNSKTNSPNKSTSSNQNSNGSKNNNSKKSTVKSTTKKNIIIALGASQINRIAGPKFLNLQSYTSKSGKKYKASDGTLNFVYKSGSGFTFQSGKGWKKANSIINKYSKHKSDVTFYVFFTLIGNNIKSYECSDLKTSNQSLANQISKYNSLIAGKQQEGYNVKGYVTSMHPVDPANPNKVDAVVKNSDKNKCAKGYRSNYKYKLYNNVMEIFVKKQKNVSYVETFDSIMNSKFQFTNAWQDYKTTDGVHWNKPTAYKYFDFWMSQVGGI